MCNAVAKFHRNVADRGTAAGADTSQPRFPPQQATLRVPDMPAEYPQVSSGGQQIRKMFRYVPRRRPLRGGCRGPDLLPNGPARPLRSRGSPLDTLTGHLVDRLASIAYDRHRTSLGRMRSARAPELTLQMGPSLLSEMTMPNGGGCTRTPRRSKGAPIPGSG